MSEWPVNFCHLRLQVGPTKTNRLTRQKREENQLASSDDIISNLIRSTCSILSDSPCVPHLENLIHDTLILKFLRPCPLIEEFFSGIIVCFCVRIFFSLTCVCLFLKKKKKKNCLWHNDLNVLTNLSLLGYNIKGRGDRNLICPRFKPTEQKKKKKIVI